MTTCPATSCNYPEEMALEASDDLTSQLTVPLVFPVSGSEGILQALRSHSSLSESLLRLARPSIEFPSDVMDSIILGTSSTSGSAVSYGAAANLTLPAGAYLQIHENTCMEPHTSIPSSPMSFSSDNFVNDFSSADTYSYLCQAQQKEKEIRRLGGTIASTGLSKSKLETCLESFPVKTKHEQNILIPIPKKPRLDADQENFQQQQQFIQGLLLKEFEDRNTRLKTMIKQHGQHNQQQPLLLHSVPNIRGLHLQPRKDHMGSLLRDQGSQQGIFTPLIDGDICSRQYMQYLYHLRNLAHDNRISYWKKFVSEYYAPGSRKRWCFSNYKNIEQHATGVFCPKVMETWFCDICGSRSGKGLEATFEILPRLFKIKFESGVLDEMMFVDFPQTHKIPSGLVLEYRKAVQESVYENFRVIHEGTLRIVFRHDLKIMSWEFCAQNHEEFMLRGMVAPQINQLVQAAEKCHEENQNGVSLRAGTEHIETAYKTFASVGSQLARNIELPLVNDLGYPKRFIRCLQIAEVANSMKDLMAFSRDRKMGPIESLKNYSQGTETSYQMNEKQEMEPLFTGAHPVFHINGHQTVEKGITLSSGKSALTLVNPNYELVGPNSLVPSMSNLHSEHGKNLHQALVEKLLEEMVVANREKNAKDMCTKPNDQTTRVPRRHSTFTSFLTNGLPQRGERSYELHFGECSSNVAASTTASLPKAVNSSAVSQTIAVKQEPNSPGQSAVDFRGLSAGYCFNFRKSE